MSLKSQEQFEDTEDVIRGYIPKCILEKVASIGGNQMRVCYNGNYMGIRLSNLDNSSPKDK
jgi:hypothetical protein